MRIAFIAPSFGEAFGQERAVADSMALLRESGHTVSTFEDPEMNRLHTFSPPHLIKKASSSLLQKLKGTSTEIVHFVDQFDFRILNAVTNNYPTLLTAHTVAPSCPASHRLIYRQEICPERSGITCLLHHHRYGCLRHFKNDLHRLNAVQNYLLRRWALKRFTGMIAISRYVEDTLTRDGFDSRRVFQIYNSVKGSDGPGFPSAPKRLIVTASRLVELKGIEYTLRSLKLLEKEDWAFWILGEGPERKKLEALTEDLGLGQRVTFKGQTSRIETEQILRSALFVTQTNVGPEGFGLSVAEAQALGKPVVAFNVPALNEIVVHGETGYLIPPRNISELAEAIGELLKDSAMRLYFGSQAREHMAKVFSPQNHLKKTEQVYEQCLKSFMKATGSLKRKVDKSSSISLP